MSSLSRSKKYVNEFLSAVQTVERGSRDLVLGSPRASSIYACPTAIWAAMHGIEPTVIPDGGAFYVMAKGHWAEGPTAKYMNAAGWVVTGGAEDLLPKHRYLPVEGRPDGFCCRPYDTELLDYGIWERKDASVDRYVEIAQLFGGCGDGNEAIRQAEPGWYDQVQVYMEQSELYWTLFTIFCQDQSVSRERLKRRHLDTDPLVMFIIIEKDEGRVKQILEKAQMVKDMDTLPTCSVPKEYCTYMGTSFCGCRLEGGGVKP